jgi:hypothetical protein
LREIICAKKFHAIKALTVYVRIVAFSHVFHEETPPGGGVLGLRVNVSIVRE